MDDEAPEHHHAAANVIDTRTFKKPHNSIQYTVYCASIICFHPQNSNLKNSLLSNIYCIYNNLNLDYYDVMQVH